MPGLILSGFKKVSSSNFLFSLNTVIFRYLLLIRVAPVQLCSRLYKSTESYLLILSLRDISLTSMNNIAVNVLVYLLVRM